MGFKDLFKPKYEHSDYKVRIESLKELDDQEIITNMAKNDKNWRVRLEAVKKVNSDAVLADIANNEMIKIFYLILLKIKTNLKMFV